MGVISHISTLEKAKNTFMRGFLSVQLGGAKSFYLKLSCSKREECRLFIQIKSLSS